MKKNIHCRSIRKEIDIIFSNLLYFYRNYFLDLDVRRLTKPLVNVNMRVSLNCVVRKADQSVDQFID